MQLERSGYSGGPKFNFLASDKVFVWMRSTIKVKKERGGADKSGPRRTDKGKFAIKELTLMVSSTVYS